MQRITSSSTTHQPQLTDEKRKQVKYAIPDKANDDFLFW